MKYKAKMKSGNLLGLCNAECEEARECRGADKHTIETEMLRDEKLQRFGCQGSNPSAFTTTF